jgi:hypothetical protein
LYHRRFCCWVDVIVGPGCSKHSGNSKFRQFTKAYKRARFQTNPKIETVKAVTEVVAFWRNLTPRGRFLTQSKGNGQWEEVDETQAMRIASFFLMNNNQRGELKRQKSIDAIKEGKKGPTGVEQPMSAMSISSNQGQLPIHNVQQHRASMQSLDGGLGPDMLADLEPVPIGPVSSLPSRPASLPSRTNSGMAWGIRNNMKPPPQEVFNNKSNLMLPPPRQKPLGQPKTDDDFGGFDFNPIPIGGMGSLDEFDPLPFGMLAGNGQQQQQTDQVQLSVNMVVPGSANFQLTTDTGNGVIQISAQQGMNSGNQEQMMGMGMMNPMSMSNNNGNMRSSGSNNTSQSHMNEYQINVFGGNGGCDNNGTSMPGKGNNNVGVGSPMINPMMMNANTGNNMNPMMMNGNGNGMNPMMMNANTGNSMNPMMMNGNSNGNNMNPMMMNPIGGNSMNPMMMNANGGNNMNPMMMKASNNGNSMNPMIMNNNDLMKQQQNMAAAQRAMNGNMMMGQHQQQNMGSAQGFASNMNMNGGMNGSMNMNGGMNGNMNMNAGMGDNGNGVDSNGLRWNKNKVANSVPCAATLTGSIFDDW